MPANLPNLNDADLNHAVQIANRVWWVGHVLTDDVFQCHVYLLEQGDQSVLFDPGSRLTFAGTLRKIEEVIPFTQIRYFVCHHQDPDIAAALPLIDAIVERPDAVVVTHWRSEALLKHYGLKLPFWLVDQHDWRLPLEDRELEFIFTPYAHFPGAICSFDRSTGVLFSSDLFGGFTERPTLVAQDESHFEVLRPFHEHYMPSRDILDFAISQIERYPVTTIAPQHGSIIPQSLVPFMIDKLRHLDCGIYLYAREDTDIHRLSRLNATLREITETMLLYRDFRDIADQLFRVVSRSLPVERIDYYASLEDDRVLSLTHETRFSGFFGDAPDELATLFGKSREEWGRAHDSDPALADHALHAGAFCSRHSEDGSVITLPLFAPGSERIQAVALLRLPELMAVTDETEQVIQQIAMPLQVALEREVIYRSIEEERQRAYQRSIRDPLTGLFTRVYMQDVVVRQCGFHDRDSNAPIAAVMVDVDHFKRINDGYGHAAGDQVLRQVASVLQRAADETDVPVRFGGEEFIVFLMGASAFDAEEQAERIRAELEATPFDIGAEGALKVTASLGVAMRAQFEPLEELLQRVDKALYRAKEGGRNRVQRAEQKIEQE